MKIAEDITQLIGDTPLVRLPRLTAELKPQGEVTAKLEFFNPVGSVKDRIGVSMIEALEAQGLIEQDTIIEPTSGNTGIALAFVAAAKGLKLILVDAREHVHERRKMLVLLGAKLELTPAEKGMAGAVARARDFWPRSGLGDAPAVREPRQSPDSPCVPPPRRSGTTPRAKWTW